MRHAGCLGRYDFVEHANFMSPKPTYKMETRHGACGYSGQAWLVHLGEQDQTAPDQWAVVSGNIVSGEGLVQHLGVRSKANSPAHIRDTWQVFDRGVQQEGTTTIRSLDHEPKGFLVTKPRKPLKRAVPPARQPSLQHQLRAHAQPQQRPAGLPLRSIDDAAESSVRPAFVIVPLAAGVVCLIISTVFSTGRQRGAGRGGAIAAPVSTQQPQWPNQPAAGAAPEAHSRRMRTAVGSPASITRHLHTQGYEEIAFDEDDNDKEVDGLRANRAHHPLGNRV